MPAGLCSLPLPAAPPPAPAWPGAPPCRCHECCAAGTLARCATAFNVRQLCLVGSRQFNTFGAHGSSEYVDFCHYNTLDECCQDLKDNKGAGIPRAAPSCVECYRLLKGAACSSSKVQRARA